MRKDAEVSFEIRAKYSHEERHEKSDPLLFKSIEIASLLKSQGSPIRMLHSLLCIGNPWTDDELSG